MDKIGAKNKKLFILLTVLFLLIIGIFSYFINYELKKGDNTYAITSGSIIYDENDNYIELKSNANLKKGFDGKYYLTYTYEDIDYKDSLGKNVVVYKKGDYKINLYGNAYRITAEGEVEKLTGETEIIKAGSPFFYKLDDRKYLFVDKKLLTEDKTINTSDYLIVKLDKQGNATFLNYENNFKTIKPLVLKGTKYDFDIANEKLIINKDFVIDLKTVIGSSNKYVEKTEEKETNKKDENSNSSNDNETTQDKSKYYDEYFTTVKNSFNNLSSSVTDINKNIKNELNKDDAYLDLTRWTAIKNITADYTKIKIDYTVFDPNNEYSEIFIVYKDNNEEKKIQLSKTSESYNIQDLIPDTEYQISYGYRLVNAVGDSTVDVINDTVKIKTKDINISINITKVTSSKIYYKVTFNNSFVPESCNVTFNINNNKEDSKTIKQNEVINGVFNGSFSYSQLGNFISLNLNNVIYDGRTLNYSTSTKIVN